MILTPAGQALALLLRRYAFPAAICGWAWSRRRRTKSARPSIRFCCIAFITIRTLGKYSASDHEFVRGGGVLTMLAHRRVRVAAVREPTGPTAPHRHPLPRLPHTWKEAAA